MFNIVQEIKNDIKMTTEEQYLERAKKAIAHGTKMTIEEIVEMYRKSDAKKAKKEKTYWKKLQAKQAVMAQVENEWAQLTPGQRLQRQEDIRLQSVRNQAKAL